VPMDLSPTRPQDRVNDLVKRGDDDGASWEGPKLFQRGVGVSRNDFKNRNCLGRL
jgi:hypothetical protein